MFIPPLGITKVEYACALLGKFPAKRLFYMKKAGSSRGTGCFFAKKKQT